MLLKMSNAVTIIARSEIQASEPFLKYVGLDSSDYLFGDFSEFWANPL